MRYIVTDGYFTIDWHTNLQIQIESDWESDTMKCQSKVISIIGSDTWVRYITDRYLTTQQLIGALQCTVQVSGKVNVTRVCGAFNTNVISVIDNAFPRKWKLATRLRKLCVYVRTRIRT